MRPCAAVSRSIADAAELPDPADRPIPQRVLAIPLLIHEHELHPRADFVHAVPRNDLVPAQMVGPDLVRPRVHDPLIRLREEILRGLGDLSLHHDPQRLVRYRQPLDLDVVRLAELDPDPATIAEHSAL